MQVVFVIVMYGEVNKRGNCVQKNGKNVRQVIAMISQISFVSEFWINIWNAVLKLQKMVDSESKMAILTWKWSSLIQEWSISIWKWSILFRKWSILIQNGQFWFKNGRVRFKNWRIRLEKADWYFCQKLIWFELRFKMVDLQSKTALLKSFCFKMDKYLKCSWIELSWIMKKSWKFMVSDMSI